MTYRRITNLPPELAQYLDHYGISRTGEIVIIPGVKDERFFASCPREARILCDLSGEKLEKWKNLRNKGATVSNALIGMGLDKDLYRG